MTPFAGQYLVPMKWIFSMKTDGTYKARLVGGSKSTLGRFQPEGDLLWQCGSEDVRHEWDALIKNFNKHKYTVTDCTDKEFVGINIIHDVQLNYHMDKRRRITEIVKEANPTGAKEEKLQYPMDNLPVSKKDCATEDQKQECAKYPYRRVVGQLIYGRVHTLITIMHALNMGTILE